MLAGAVWFSLQPEISVAKMGIVAIFAFISLWGLAQLLGMKEFNRVINNGLEMFKGLINK